MRAGGGGVQVEEVLGQGEHVNLSSDIAIQIGAGERAQVTTTHTTCCRDCRSWSTRIDGVGEGLRGGGGGGGREARAGYD